MDHEAEVIREQMDDTREALAKKIETLEHQVAGAVENVTGTVSAVSHTVEQVKEAVTGTVDSVRESVSDTVQTVKNTVRDTFDVTGHVRRHPWIGLGASFVAGFVSGRLLARLMPHGDMPSLASGGQPNLEEQSEYDRSNGRRQQEQFFSTPPTQATPPQQVGPRHGLLGSIMESLGPEVGKLKGMAIGAALGIARDALSRATPPELGGRVADMINDVTAKLGGEVFHGPVLESLGRQGHQGAEPGPASASGPGW